VTASTSSIRNPGAGGQTASWLTRLMMMKNPVMFVVEVVAALTR
jgi:high-affinity K+ transport system ATPase subunit B